jgi:hypothetical protein
MSNGPEQDPTVEKKEAFVPAFKPEEAEPKTDEEIRSEYVGERTARAADWTEKNNQLTDQLNAERPPRGIVDKLTGRNTPYEYQAPLTERDIAEVDANADNEAFDAEKVANEKAEADATAEQARAEQERLEKERQATSEKERAEIEAAVNEHMKQKAELRKRLTRPSQIWTGPGRHYNNPDFLTESQIGEQLKEFDADWEAKLSQERRERAAAAA